MSRPVSMLVLIALFLFAVQCSTHGGAPLFAGVLLTILLMWLTLRVTLRVRRRSLVTSHAPIQHARRSPSCR